MNIKEILNKLSPYKLAVPVFFLCSLLALWQFGSVLPYFNVLQDQLQKILLLCLLFSTLLFSNFARWISCLLFVGFSYYHGENIFVSLLTTALVFPPIEYTKLQFTGRIFSTIKSLPYFWKVVPIFILGILYTYWPMRHSYFEGDEWVFFRLFTPLLQSSWWWIEGFITTFDSSNEVLLHKTPLANMLYVIEFKIFGLDFTPYLLVSLFSHLLVTLSILLFLLKITKNRLLSFLAAFIFAVSAVHSQGVTWIMAAIHTQFAVGFGFFSLFAALKSFETRDKYWPVLAAVSLLFSLWSKETGIIFIPLLFLLCWQHGQLQLKKTILPALLGAVTVIFLLTQLTSRFSEPQKSVVVGNSPSDFATESSEPWAYRALNALDKYDYNQLSFWTGALLLKAPSQSIFPQQTILNIAIWITDHQFPFFNQEKSVRGTTYNAFIFSPGAEFVSYSLSIIVVIFIITFAAQKYRKTAYFLYIYFILSVIPLIGNIIQFPWWGYTALIDSRHLYHISPSIIILIIFSLDCCLDRISILSNRKTAVLVATIAITSIFYTNAVHKIIAAQQKDAHFADRKKIIKLLQTEISQPPKDLIIYTRSNSTYYGFATLMLPFQTAFSHSLPVIFSDQYHTDGNNYPDSFYTARYMAGQENSLATEGYHQDGEFGLGYYLNKIPLIKLLEKTNKDLDTVHAFDFNGQTHEFFSTTQATRRELLEFMSKREIFKTWKRYGSVKEGFSFQADPSWLVEINPETHTYTVSDEMNRSIIVITAIDNSDGKDFATYVNAQLSKDLAIPDARYTMEYLEPDLEDKHNIYFHPTQVNVFYLFLGNNTMFYKVTVNMEEQAQLLLRTLQFKDSVNEDISL
jgi:hypothetical protein